MRQFKDGALETSCFSLCFSMVCTRARSVELSLLCLPLAPTLLPARLFPYLRPLPRP